MRVHVDPEKCQGHNRCYALAPELFDVDDLGYAHELQRRRGAARAGGQGPAGRGQLSRVRDRDHGVTSMTTSTRRSPTGPPTSTTPTRSGSPTRSRSGTSCASECPVAHTDRYGGTWLPVTPRRRRRGRVRHRALHVALGRRERDPARRRRPARADRHRAADHLRPAVPHAGPPAAAARRSRPKPIAGARAVHPRAVPRAARRDRRAKTEVDAAVDYAQHIPLRVIVEDARLPAGGRRHLPPVHPHGARGRRRVAPRSGRRRSKQGELDEYLDARIDEHLAEPARRPHHVPARGRARRQQARIPTTCAARWCC